MSRGRKKRVGRREELTFRHNLRAGRHGWLRLTPAYSIKVVEGILNDHQGARKVLDPFSGTGTTPLCAAYRGMAGVSVDINPFLIWLGRVKSASYSSEEVERARQIGAVAASKGANEELDGCAPPNIYNIGRWWTTERLEFLCRLKGSLDELAAGDSAVKDLLSIAFLRAMIGLSNAAFNHQSMSFRDDSDQQGDLFEGETPEYAGIFTSNLEDVLRSASENPEGTSRVLLGDSRALEDTLDGTAGSIDLLITSPPYPNRMSYIRELRPYMYWLGYLEEAREAAELDWAAVGGTWGVATSRLKDWTPTGEAYVPGYLDELAEQVEDAHEKNGLLMANYVRKYFEDMWFHFASAREMLAKGAKAFYVIGNSTFYGTVIPAERLYVDQMRNAGFVDCGAHVIRKRNSKKELYEFVVEGTVPS